MVTVLFTLSVLACHGSMCHYSFDALILYTFDKSKTFNSVHLFLIISVSNVDPEETDWQMGPRDPNK